MDFKFGKSIALFALSVSLVACGSGTGSEKTADDNIPAEETKEVEIYGTTYTLNKDWLVLDKGNDTTWIYFQDTEPEKIENVIFVSVYDGVYIDNLEEAKKDGLTEADIVSRQNIIDNTFKSFKESLIAAGIVSSTYSEEIYDLPKTPVMYLKGVDQNGWNNEVYLFMNDYHRLVMLQTYLRDMSYSPVVRNIVDTLEFSYDGWIPTDSKDDKKTQSHTSSTFTNKYGTPTTKCNHPGCNNYIASSGDTNCCTEHSNKCLNCGKYIDEDAMYCMDCIEKEVKGSSSNSSKGCDGEKYGDGSDWAKYDKNKDGCISDAEFQTGIMDTIENDY